MGYNTNIKENNYQGQNDFNATILLLKQTTDDEKVIKIIQEYKFVSEKISNNNKEIIKLQIENKESKNKEKRLKIGLLKYIKANELINELSKI